MASMAKPSFTRAGYHVVPPRQHKSQKQLQWRLAQDGGLFLICRIHAAAYRHNRAP